MFPCCAHSGVTGSSRSLRQCCALAGAQSVTVRFEKLRDVQRPCHARSEGLEERQLVD
jgi:hypothetical protein